MNSHIRTRTWVRSLALVLPFAVAAGQEIRLDGSRDAGALHRQRVTLDSDKFTVSAGKPEWIELSFHVDPGFHINSHVPHDETLIPTSLKLTPSPRIRVFKDSYPPGLPLHLNVGAGETLSTYAGDFRVRVQVLAAEKGDATLAGTLHYQACDAASCYPPRDLPVTVVLNAQ